MPPNAHNCVLTRLDRRTIVMSRNHACVDPKRFSLLSSVHQCKCLQLARRLLRLASLAVLFNRIVSPVTMKKPGLIQAGFNRAELSGDSMQPITDDQVTYWHAIDRSFTPSPFIVVSRPLCRHIELTCGTIVTSSIVVTVHFNRIRFDNHS